MLADLKQANYGWVLFAMLFTLLANISRAYRWGMLIEPLGVKPKLSNLFYSLSVGYFANLAAPRLGEVTRCSALYEVEKTTLDTLIGTVIAERVIDVITLLVLIVGVIFLSIEKFSTFFWDTIFKGKVHSLLAGSPIKIFLLIFIPLVFAAFIFIFRKKIIRFHFIKKVVDFIKGIGEGLHSVIKMKNRGWFILHTIFIWGLYCLSGYFCFFSVTATSHLGGVAALFILVLGGIGMSAPVQGGIGAYHIIVQSGLVFLGVASDKALVYATIVHSSQMLFMAALGSISIIMLNIEKRKQLKHA